MLRTFGPVVPLKGIDIFARVHNIFLSKKPGKKINYGTFIQWNIIRAF